MCAGRGRGGRLAIELEDTVNHLLSVAWRKYRPTQNSMTIFAVLMLLELLYRALSE
jgi:hypothetical protein